MAGGRELAGRRAQQQVESLLGPVRKMAVGLRQVLEVGLAADDRDRGVGQAGEIAWQVAHIVQAVLDVPVVADQGRQLLGSGPVGGQQGECVGHCGAGGPGLEDMPLAFDAAMPLVEGFTRGGVGEVHALQVGQHGGLVVLDGGDHVVRAAGDGDGVCQIAHRRDLVGLAGNLELSQHQAAAMLDGRDQHAAAVIRTPTAKARARPTLPGLLFSSTTNPTPSIESPPRVWRLTCRRE